MRRLPLPGIPPAKPETKDKKFFDRINRINVILTKKSKNLVNPAGYRLIQFADSARETPAEAKVAISRLIRTAASMR